MVQPTKERKEYLASRLNRRVATFFDFDGTVFERQQLIEFMLSIGDRFPERQAHTEPIRAAYATYKNNRTYDFTPVIRATVAAIRPIFTGLTEETVREFGHEFVSRFTGMTYLFPRTLIATLREMPIEERGLIIAITGSPREIAEPIGQLLGFDLVIGMEYEVQGGVYTGECDERTVNDKGGIVDELVQTFGLDLAQSIALGDSRSDIPMLDRVGFPFAVNPHDHLHAYARKNPHIIWVNDRQKNGVTMFHADGRSKFTEILLKDTLPDYLSHFPSLQEAILKSP